MSIKIKNQMKNKLFDHGFRKVLAPVPLLGMVVLLSIVAPSVTPLWAATHYIRDGASGANNGSNWTDAWDDLPGTLIRGDTYYIADGTYKGEHVFNDAESGSTYIYIKKAIVDDHGTETGWNNSYGDGQAVFRHTTGTCAFEIRAGYYDFDGQVGGGPGNWKSGHGFKIVSDNFVADSTHYLVNFSDVVTPAKNVFFRHFEFEQDGLDKDGPYAKHGIIYSAGASPYDLYRGPENITFQYCYLHHCSYCPILAVQPQNWTLEYSWIGPSSSGTGSNSHAEAIAIHGSNGFTVRYSVFSDVEGTGFIVMKRNFDLTDNNWQVYGNIFQHTDEHRATHTDMTTQSYGPFGCAGSNTGPITNSNFYNNTIYNVMGFNSGILFESNVGNTFNAYNNIWIDCKGSDGYDNARFSCKDASLSHNYNSFYNCGLESGPLNTNEIENISGNPLVDPDNESYSLLDGTARGISISGAFYNIDMLGNLRGADNVWDRGALEFNSGSTPLQYELTINGNGNGSARVNGTLRSLPWSGIFTADSTVALEAIPDSSWQFLSWSGSLSGSTNPTSILMDSNESVTVNFSVIPADTFTLTLSQTGSGNVKVNDTLRALPLSETFTTDSEIKLEAVPDESWEFSGWSGSLSGNSNPTVVTMDSNKTINTNFLNLNIEISAHWTLTDNEGATALDSSGNNHTAALRNNPVWAAEDGLSFNNNNEYLEIDDAQAFAMSAPTTLSAWVKLRAYDNDWPKIIIKPHTSYAAPWEMYALDLGQNGNTPRFLVSDGIVDGASAMAADSTHILSLDQWYHVAGTYDGGSISLYLDGTLIASQTVNFQIGTNSMPLCLGGRLGNNTLNGYLSDIRIYEGLFSAEQIQALYVQGRAVTANAAPTGHWKLNDHSPDTTVDSSGNGYTANLVGQPLWGHPWGDEDFIVMTTKNQAMVIPSAAIRPQAGTIAVWVSPASVSGAQYLFGHVYSGSNRIALLTINGNLALSLGSQSLLQQGIAYLPANQLTHIALTWDNGQYAVHVNGQQMAAGTYSGLTALYPTVDVGNYGDPVFRTVGFLGTIDDVRTYSRALTADEITAMYQTYDIKENREIAFLVEGIDEYGNPLSYSASNLPAGAVFESDSQNFFWQPWYNQAGQYNVIFNASGQPSQNVTITVEDVILQDWYRAFLEANGKL